MTEQSQPTLGPVALRVADLQAMSDFYCTLLGLEVLSADNRGQVLAAHGIPLLRLEAAPDLSRAPMSRPGLYHAAFLLPTRADLGRWLAHAARLGVGLGSGDHLVSEAFYLNDPEGNGIEVYADRPREGWRWADGQVQMDTLSVDVPGVLEAAGLTPAAVQQGAVPAYAGAPAGTRVGHVHLKVGDAAQAAQFYAEALGLEQVSAFPGAAFLSWGGYHHHLGLNEWHSRGQGQPATEALGLGGFEVAVPDLAALRERWQGEGMPWMMALPLTLTDPWGNRVRVVQGVA